MKRESEGVLVSEQLARRLHVNVGSAISIPTAHGALAHRGRRSLSGLRQSQGQPASTSILWSRIGLRCGAAELQLACRGPALAPQLMADMQDKFGPVIGHIIVIRPRSRRCPCHLREKTFAVTAALNTLTLLVSGVALFAGHCSRSAICA